VDAAETVGEYAHVAKDRAEHLAEDAGDKLNHFGKDMTQLVKTYPIQALLVGFGVGMLLGRVSRA